MENKNDIIVVGHGDNGIEAIKARLESEGVSADEGIIVVGDTPMVEIMLPLTCHEIEKLEPLPIPSNDWKKSGKPKKWKLK